MVLLTILDALRELEQVWLWREEATHSGAARDVREGENETPAIELTGEGFCFWVDAN
jgi:hypothetical protein